MTTSDDTHTSAVSLASRPAASTNAALARAASARAASTIDSSPETSEPAGPERSARGAEEVAGVEARGAVTWSVGVGGGFETTGRS